MTTTIDRSFWVAEGQRPPGQPGTVWYGEVRESHFWPDETIRTGLTYPAVLGDEGLFIWRDGAWILSPGYADSFTPGEEWQADCDHAGTVPWRTCDTEADCASLRCEDERTWGR